MHKLWNTTLKLQIINDYVNFALLLGTYTYIPQSSEDTEVRTQYHYDLTLRTKCDSCQNDCYCWYSQRNVSYKRTISSMFFSSVCKGKAVQEDMIEHEACRGQSTTESTRSWPNYQRMALSLLCPILYHSLCSKIAEQTVANSRNTIITGIKRIRRLSPMSFLLVTINLFLNSRKARIELTIVTRKAGARVNTP